MINGKSCFIIECSIICSKYILINLFVSSIDSKFMKGNLVETIPVLGKAYKLSFDLYLYGKLRDWGSIIHLTTKDNAGKYGARTPAIWTSPDSTKVSVFSAINGNNNYAFTTGDLPVNKKIHVVVEQKFLSDNRYQFSVYVDGKQVFTIENKKAEQFKNVKVYIADPWYEPANGRIENIVIENKGNSIANTYNNKA